KFRRLLEDYEVDKLLVGLPVSLDGAEHAQAAWVREVAAGIAGLYGLPVGFADERLSSGQAKTVLRSMGYTEKQMRGKLDKTAASIFLQSHLDWLVGQAGGGKGGWDADQGSGQGGGWGSGQVPGPAVGHVTGQAGGGKGGWDADQGSGQAEMTIRTR
ncbi:MAG: Holliday junction resolvase RuvX, partial [Coriobacteriia bacterium]|nr:Holliday junction resolvase RuvX [Coriobacteriia bacterium]